MDEIEKYLVSRSKISAALISLFKDGVTVDELEFFVNNNTLENLYKYAQKMPEGMATGTGAELPKQGYFFKVIEDGYRLTNDELLANPTLLYAKSTE